MRCMLLMAFVATAGCTFDADAPGGGALLADAGTGSAVDAAQADARPIDGSSLADAQPIDASIDAMPPAPLAHCQAILDAGQSTGDGSYQIDPDGLGGEPAFMTYCDMTTSGGGWTLAYAYRFTDSVNFVSGPNAVTPRPAWAYSEIDSVPVSTTPPSSLSDFNALDFKRWGSVGNSFMVQSDINHWLVCDEGTGSFVTETAGSISCSIVNTVATACTDVVPTNIGATVRGPYLSVGSLYYYWDGSTSANWPTHDPCGNNAANHLAGVVNPSGAIFLRP